MADTVRLPYQKSLNKVQKTREALRFNTEWVKDSQLKDKLYKQYKELAEDMAKGLQYLINNDGAGLQEVVEEQMQYINWVKKEKFNPQQEVNLKFYINKLLNSLKIN